MGAPEEVLPGVFGVNLGFVNAFFIADDAVTLVDTGIKARAGQIEAALKDVGRRDDVRNIALTHHHPDHRGGVGLFRREGVKLFVHPIDAQVVRGDRKAPGPQTGVVLKAAFALIGPLMRPPTAPVDVELTEGDEIPDTGGLRAIHTPGHTLGHVSYLHPDKRILFVGDAARNIRELANTPPNFAEDMAEARRTIAKIASLDFDTAVFGHGRVLRGKANAEFRKLADTLAG